MLIREGGSDDLGRCLELFEIGREDAPVAYATVSQVAVESDLHMGRILVAEDQGKVCGMISSIPVPGKTMLYMLVVDRDMRGGKLAPALIRAAMNKWHRCTALIVPHIRRSYENAGMELTGFVMEDLRGTKTA